MEKYLKNILVFKNLLTIISKQIRKKTCTNKDCEKLLNVFRRTRSLNKNDGDCQNYQAAGTISLHTINMKRKNFLLTSLFAIPMDAFAQLKGFIRTNKGIKVAAGQDRFENPKYGPFIYSITRIYRDFCSLHIIILLGFGFGIRVPLYFIASPVVYSLITFLLTLKNPKWWFSNVVCICFVPFIYWYPLLWNDGKINWTDAVHFTDSSPMLLILPLTFSISTFVSLSVTRLKKTAGKAANRHT